MAVEKITFYVFFILFAGAAYIIRLRASGKIVDEKNKKIPLYNPVWFFYLNIFLPKDRTLCVWGAMVNLSLIALVVWGFPKYVFEW